MYELVTPAKAGVQTVAALSDTGSAHPSVAFAGMTATFYFTEPEQQDQCTWKINRTFLKRGPR